MLLRMREDIHDVVGRPRTAFSRSPLRCGARTPACRVDTHVDTFCVPSSRPSFRGRALCLFDPIVLAFRLTCRFMWATICAVVSNGPKVRPASISANPSASFASMARRCAVVSLAPPALFNAEGETRIGCRSLNATVVAISLNIAGHARTPGSGTWGRQSWRQTAFLGGFAY
jgi:hypothetical protein